MMKRTRRRGQAIVEFALSATLIFFLLAAAIDLGMIFFAVQGLRNAAQEGATYGSRWLVFDGAGRRVLDTNLIRDKVRTESGSGNRMGFVNLLDLNGNGTNDANESGVIASYITVQMLSDSPDYDGNPLNNGSAPNYTPCANAATAGPGECYAYVTVSNDHNLIFPLSPVFGNSVKLTSSYLVPIRDSYASGSGKAPTPIPEVQPTPTNVPIKFEIEVTSPGNNVTINTASQLVGAAQIVVNTTGSPVKDVVFTLATTGYTNSWSDTGAPYCMKGNGTCGGVTSTEWGNLPKGKKSYTLTAVATTNSGLTASDSVTFSIKR